MIYLEVGENGYVTGVYGMRTEGSEEYVYAPPEGFYEDFPYYKLIDGELVYDSKKKLEAEEKRKKQERIAELKGLLALSDYIAAKLAEGAATREEYADKLSERQSWRDEINKLESL